MRRGPPDGWDAVMTPNSIMGFVVRLIGLVACLYGLHLLISTVWNCIAMTAFGGASYSILDFVVEGAPGAGWLLGGLPLLRFADHVVRFTYRDKPTGVCGKCGYDLRGSTGRCPECGTVAPVSV